MPQAMSGLDLRHDGQLNDEDARRPAGGAGTVREVAVSGIRAGWTCVFPVVVIVLVYWLMTWFPGQARSLPREG